MKDAIALRVITIVQIFGPSLVQFYKIYSECAACDHVKCQTHKQYEMLVILVEVDESCKPLYIPEIGPIQSSNIKI